MSLVARYLEQHGIPTMCIGSALDILTAGNPPRATFVDFPLGHSVGKPFDAEGQIDIVRRGLQGLERMTAPGIEILDVRWSDDEDWKREASDGASGGDVRQPRDTTPRYQYEEDRLLAEGG
ncbi:MAG: hypothetical protein MI806_04960 [Minwuiales bacterium]|nr:hypothetical protein [Minwuiales bacterium]